MASRVSVSKVVYFSFDKIARISARVIDDRDFRELISFEARNAFHGGQSKKAQLGH